MNKKCYIVGAGDNSGTIFSKGKDEYVIAADGGLAVLEKMNIKPDFVLGDFDSLGYIPNVKNIEVHKVEKDDTDMMLSVEKAAKEGYNEIEIFGGTGGRVDHTVANFQTMLWASKRNIKIKMTDKNYVYYMITNGTLEIEGTDGADLSVFAFGGDAKGVTIKGGKYQAEDVTLTMDNPTAVSNSFIGKMVHISVDKGSLLVIAKK